MVSSAGFGPRPRAQPETNSRVIARERAAPPEFVSGSWSMTTRFGYEAHKSAVRELNRRAAEVGLNWRLRSSFETLPVVASSSVSAANQLVRLLLAVVVSSTAPARRLLTQATSRLPDTWPGRAAVQATADFWNRATADLWDRAAVVLFSLLDRATSLIPRGSATTVPIPAPATKLSLVPALVVFAVVFAVGSVAPLVAPNAVRALQEGAPNTIQALQNGRTHATQAFQNGRTHAVQALQDGRTHAMQTLQNGRTHAAQAVQNVRAQVGPTLQSGRAHATQAVRNGRTHAAQALQNGRARAAQVKQSFNEQVLSQIQKLRRSSTPRDSTDAPKQEPPAASQEPEEVHQEDAEDLDEADLPQAFRRSE